MLSHNLWKRMSIFCSEFVHLCQENIRNLQFSKQNQHLNFFLRVKCLNLSILISGFLMWKVSGFQCSVLRQFLVKKLDIYFFIWQQYLNFNKFQEKFAWIFFFFYFCFHHYYRFYILYVCSNENNPILKNPWLLN